MSNPLYDALFAPHEGSSKTFLFLPDGETVSYDAFLRLAARFANVLTGYGIEAGDRVAVQVKKSPQAFALYAACVRAGAAILPLNTAYTPNEIAYFVDDAAPRLIVCDQEAEDALLRIARQADARIVTLNGDGSGSLSHEASSVSEVFETVARDPDDLAAILYTSGTTGRSKGAMLTQSNLLSNARSLVDAWHFTEDDVLLHALPIFHTHGLFVANNVLLLAGGSIIFLPTFQIDEIIKWLHKATSMMGIPTFYTRLLADTRFSKSLLRQMRLFTSGSAPLLAETHVEFEKRTGHSILERYGMTETNMNTSNPYDGARRPGTVGFPLPGVELRVVDQETGSTLANGDIGVIEVRGPNVFKGYWRNPEKTREEFRDDGFFVTGDLGRIDEANYLHIVGRAKDLVISGGYNIYPNEIEFLLDALDGIFESAVIGVPHRDFGEGVVAVVVPAMGTVFNEQAILSEIAGKIARFKQPKRIFAVDELPRNTMGKVQKNILRERYRGTFSPEDG